MVCLNYAIKVDDSSRYEIIGFKKSGGHIGVSKLNLNRATATAVAASNDLKDRQRSYTIYTRQFENFYLPILSHHLQVPYWAQGFETSYAYKFQRMSIFQFWPKV